VQGKSKRLRIIRGVSKEPEQVADFAAAKGFELSTDFDQAIADPRVRAVFLATPHSLHVAQISAVAAAGKPVWCEKPLALTRAEAERAIAAITNAKVVFGLGNNKRCFASMRELKRIVASGTIGDVLHIEGHYSNEHSVRVKGGWRDDPRESPGGGMTGAGLHLIDAFVNLAGPIATVDARVFSRKPPPDPRGFVLATLVGFPARPGRSACSMTCLPLTASTLKPSQPPGRRRSEGRRLDTGLRPPARHSRRIRRRARRPPTALGADARCAGFARA